jgi:hypothetical protein
MPEKIVKPSLSGGDEQSINQILTDRKTMQTMTEIISKTRFVILALMAVFAASLVAIPQTASAQSRSTFNDASPNMVRSDGGQAYVDDVDCVAVQIGSSGNLLIRTVYPSSYCDMQTVHRTFTIDFGTSPHPDLDQNGVTSTATENVVARFIFNNAFSKNATTTPAVLYVDKMNAGGTVTPTIVWQVQYRAQAKITVKADGSRIISLGAGLAIADVSQVTYNGGRQIVTYVATYDLPFSVTVSR